jgi:SAM-dependent methyltransferase
VFWKKARILYSKADLNDPDINSYLNICDEIQNTGNKGILGTIHDLGHEWVAKQTNEYPVLELGFGLGAHGRFVDKSRNDYFVSEYREKYTHASSWKTFAGRGTRADARFLPYKNGSFSTIVSLYNFEHIWELNFVFSEIHRVLRSNGSLLFAIPCEGGLAWNLGRELTTRRKFNRKYGINYDKIIAYEHVHDFTSILSILKQSDLFTFQSQAYLPFRFPSVNCNLIAGFHCRKKDKL